MVLAAHPFCEHCEKQGRTVEATDVDHITPLASGGDNSDTNLQALCKACHSRKTARFDSGFS